MKKKMFSHSTRDNFIYLKVFPFTRPQTTPRETYITFYCFFMLREIYPSLWCLRFRKKGCSGSETKHEISHKSAFDRKCTFHFYLPSLLWFWLPHKKLVRFNIAKRLLPLFKYFMNIPFTSFSHWIRNMTQISFRDELKIASRNFFFEKISDEIGIDLSFLRFVFVIDGEEAEGTNKQNWWRVKNNVKSFDLWKMRKMSFEKTSGCVIKSLCHGVLSRLMRLCGV